MMIITNGKKNWRRLKLSIWFIKWWKCFPEFSIQSWRMLSGKVLATRQYYAFENLQILMKYGAHEYTLLWSECALSLFNIRTRFSWLLFLMHLDNTKFPSPLKLILLAHRHTGNAASTQTPTLFWLYWQVVSHSFLFFLLLMSPHGNVYSNIFIYKGKTGLFLCPEISKWVMLGIIANVQCFSEMV